MLKPPHNAPAGFDWVLKLKNFAHAANELHVAALTASGKEARLSFRLLENGIWNYTFFPPGDSAKHLTGVINENLAPMPLQIEESSGGIKVSGGPLQLLIERAPWQMRFVDENGRDVWRENPADVDGLGRLFVLPLGYVARDGEISAVTQSFHLGPDEHLYGLGEKFTRLDKTGQKIISWTQDALGSTSERSHKNIPLLISSRGYGLFLNSSGRITWDLGVSSTQSCTIFQEGEPLDVFIIPGPAPADILHRYCQLTGFSPVPPKWTFGLWVSSGGTYRDQQALEKLVDGLEEHQIAADVVHIDPWWMRWRKYCDFQWNREAFPEIEQFIERLQQKGLKLCLWMQPYISIESDLFDYGKLHNYFVKRPDGEVYVIDYGLSLAPRPDGIIRTADGSEGWNAPVAIIDLTNEAAFRWFQDLMRPVLRDGADVFKTDFGEDIPEDGLFSNGETGRTMHNLYPLLYNRAVFELTRQEKGYGLVWARSAFAGSQKYPVCWSGDPAANWDSLAATIRGGLSIGLSGVPFWSNDIGGYRGMPLPELYIRWAQFALFCSHSRMHGDSPREPWYFGEEAAAIVRKYVDLRYRLFPYFYSAAIDASRSGMPVIRAMPLAFPEDPNCPDKELQFMLGESLLVAPVYDGGYSRFVFFPEGEWVDFFEGTVFEGGANVRVSAPLEKLPLFVKRGAVLPMMEKNNRIPETVVDPLILEIYPAAESEYALLENEGETHVSCSRSGKILRVNIRGSIKRNYFLKIAYFTDFEVMHVRLDDSEFQFGRDQFAREERGLAVKI